MARPQVEFGHIKVANALWEAWNRADLLASEYKVLLAIARLSYGWNRISTANYASYSTIERLAGLGRSGVRRGLKGLLMKQLIRRVRDGGPDHSTAAYQIVKDYEQWSPGVLPEVWGPISDELQQTLDLPRPVVEGIDDEPVPVMHARGELSIDFAEPTGASEKNTGSKIEPVDSFLTSSTGSSPEPVTGSSLEPDTARLRAPKDRDKDKNPCGPHSGTSEDDEDPAPGGPQKKIGRADLALLLDKRWQNASGADVQIGTKGETDRLRRWERYLGDYSVEQMSGLIDQLATDPYWTGQTNRDNRNLFRAGPRKFLNTPEGVEERLREYGLLGQAAPAGSTRSAAPVIDTASQAAAWVERHRNVLSDRWPAWASAHGYGFRDPTEFGRFLSQNQIASPLDLSAALALAAERSLWRRYERATQ